MVSFPFDGIVVIDLSQIYNGPYATYLMALAGAEVIKVEPPGGEPLRRRGEVGGAALPFAMLNGCKQSITLDLKSADGKSALLALVRGADVIVENFSPGTMERLGLGDESLRAINPRLIYASSSGYGRSGPYAAYSAMDLTIQAMSGTIHVTGHADSAPVKAGPAIADFLAGIHLYGAIATALFERERSGVARRLEVSMQDAVYASLSSNLGLHWFSQGKQEFIRTGNRHGGLAECPYNVYRTQDGYVAIICTTESHWKALVRVMGRNDLAADSRCATLKARIAHMEEIDSVVSDWTSQNSTSTVFSLLIKERVPCAPVRSLAEVMQDENMHARGALQWIDHPKLGPIVVQQSPLRYDGVPLHPLDPSRELGADTETVLRQRTHLDLPTIERLASLSGAGTREARSVTAPNEGSNGE